MTREIYEAMKAKIEIVDAPDYWEIYPNTPKGATLYKFNTAGLNYDRNYDFAFDVIQAFRTRNMWNIAQRFYKELNWAHMAFDKRLLHHD